MNNFLDLRLESQRFSHNMKCVNENCIGTTDNVFTRGVFENY